MQVSITKMREKDIQKLAFQKLIAEKWFFWLPPRTWGERDVFGVFDFIAIRRGRVIFVQLTTIDHLSHRRRKIKAFMDVAGSVPNAFIWAYDKRREAFKVEHVVWGGPTMTDVQ